MKRYDQYKDSGIAWLPKVPAHWDVKRLGTHFHSRIEANSGFEFQKAYKFNYGEIVPKNESGNPEEYRDVYVKYSKVLEDDIMINGLNLNYDFVSQRVAMVPAPGIITSAYVVLRPYTTTYAPYYCYLLKAMDSMKLFHGMGTGIRLTLSFDEVKKQLIPIPSEGEQRKMVAYLDKQITLIETRKCQRERELRTLSELKQAEIASVVTRGLNPNVPMKDSGIPWIGQIPAHWDVKYLFQIAKEHFISNKTVHHQNLLSLSYGRLVRKDINTTDGLLPASFDNYQVVEPGNIILRFTDLQNDHKSLRVGLAYEEGIITSAYVCVEVTNESVMPEYFYNNMHTYDLLKVFYSMGGGLRQSLNYNGIRKLPMLIPPPEEQADIVGYIANKTYKIDSMIEALRVEIERLNEYKQRLISDVVTGQINVQDNS